MNLTLFAAAGLALLAGSAHAEVIPVIDAVTEANVIQATSSNLVAAGKRLTIIENQVAQLVQLKNTLAALAHGDYAALSQLVPELGALGITLPLGPDTSGLIKALTGDASALGGTAILTQQLLSTNQFYAPSAPDFQAIFMNQAAVSAASSMAAAQTMLTSSTSRLNSLNTLRQNMTSPDAKAASDNTARLAGEQATAQGQTNQILALMMLQNAQKATQEAQQQQMARCAADTLAADAQASAASAAAGNVTLITTPPTTNCGPALATGSEAVASTDSSVTQVSYSQGTIGTASPVSADNSAMATMLGTSWGQTAASNASALGVNPTALAATCVLESGCTANPGGTGTISGAFQMSNGTYAQTVAEVTASDPSLASQITSKDDPASQSIAASQYLLDGAQALQATGDANPTVLDVRGYYQFGPANAAALADAPANQLMAETVSLSPSALAANNITSTTTVGQWRATVTNTIGASTASQPVLLTRT